MKLSEFLETHNIEAKRFAKQCGTSPATLGRVINGVDCRLSLAKKIVDASFGHVSIDDLYNNIVETSRKKTERNTSNRPKRYRAHLQAKEREGEGKDSSHAAQDKKSAVIPTKN